MHIAGKTIEGLRVGASRDTRATLTDLSQFGRSKVVGRKGLEVVSKTQPLYIF